MFMPSLTLTLTISNRKQDFIIRSKTKFISRHVIVGLFRGQGIPRVHIITKTLHSIHTYIHTYIPTSHTQLMKVWTHTFSWLAHGADWNRKQVNVQVFAHVAAVLFDAEASHIGLSVRIVGASIHWPHKFGSISVVVALTTAKRPAQVQAIRVCHWTWAHQYAVCTTCVQWGAAVQTSTGTPCKSMLNRSCQTHSA